MPSPIKGQWNAEGIFGKADFGYDRERDELICPAGKRLHKRTEHARNRQTEYAARRKDCRVCPLKARCTRARYRVVHRHWDQDYLDRAEQWRRTPGYRLSQRCRKRIEHLFGEAKEFMGLRRARRRGRANVTEQCLLTALVQNLKRMVAWMEQRPVGAAAAAKQVLQHIKTLYLSLSHWMRRIKARVRTFDRGDSFRIISIETIC